MTSRRAAQLIAALAAVMLLAAPITVYVFGGSSVPHTLPSWHQITVTPARREDGTSFIAAARDVSWPHTCSQAPPDYLTAQLERTRPAGAPPPAGARPAHRRHCLWHRIRRPCPGDRINAAMLAARATSAAPRVPAHPAYATTRRTARDGRQAVSRPRHDCIHRVVARDNLLDLARTYLGSGDADGKSTTSTVQALLRGPALTNPARTHP